MNTPPLRTCQNAHLSCLTQHMNHLSFCSHFSITVLLPPNSLHIPADTSQQGPQSRRLVMEPSSKSRQVLLQDVAGECPPYELTHCVMIYLVSSLKARHKLSHKHVMYSGFHRHLLVFALQYISKAPVGSGECWVVNIVPMHTITLQILPLRTTFEIKDVIRSPALTIYTRH